MPKKTNEYFSHDVDASNDPHLAAMVGEFKAEGYGIYWRTVEMMHKEGGYLNLNTITCRSIARSIESSPEMVEKVIKKCITDFNLFLEKNKKVTSRRVLKNLKKRADDKKAKSEAGKASAKKRWGVTRVKQPLSAVQQNVTKKRKGKESKEKEIKEEYKEMLLRDQKFIQPLLSSYSVSLENLNRMITDFDLWLISQEKEHENYIGYRTHFHNWSKKQYKDYQSSNGQITMVY